MPPNPKLQREWAFGLQSTSKNTQERPNFPDGATLDYASRHLSGFGAESTVLCGYGGHYLNVHFWAHPELAVPPQGMSDHSSLQLSNLALHKATMVYIFK